MLYRKKPVTVSAFKYEGQTKFPEFISDAMQQEKITADSSGMYIETLEGVMKASRGDYIIQGVNGELYPCKPDIFLKTYEPC
jgi:flagellar motor switch protein FliG